MSTATTIYLPATGDRPAEPAPYLMTEEEAVRFLRIDSTDPYKALWKIRNRGLLVAVMVGKEIRYALPDLVAFLEKSKVENPR